MGSEDRRPRGRPRSEQARRAILSATLELAAEHGPRGLRMDAVAKRAGASKETLYRWWPSKTELILDALANHGDETIPVPDTGSFATDLRTFLEATVASADSTTRRLLRALAAEAATDPSTAHLIRDRFLARRRAALDDVLKRAIARGELHRGNAAITLDLVYGSLWYRLIFDVGPIDDSWANSVARTLAMTE
jgi:AcrR family transcriptional regulator